MRRVFRLLLSLWLLSAAGFFLVGLLPFDPVAEAMQHNPSMKAADVKRLRALYHLDDPLPVRYGHWLRRFATGDWGRSRVYGEPALGLLGQRLGNTVVLFAGALGAAVLLFGPAFVLQGLFPASTPERLSLSLSTAFLCLTPFWLGLVALFVFSVLLGWFPLGGTGALEETSGLSRLRFLALPALVLAAQHVGQWLRLEHPHALSAPHTGWVQAGLAKGFSRRWLFFHRQIKPALGRLSTVWALDLPTFLGGALITETVFNWPGVARLLYESVMSKDTDVVMACLLFMGLITLLANTLADAAVGWFDPRARSGAVS